jgi:hypothetical protein
MKPLPSIALGLVILVATSKHAAGDVITDWDTNLINAVKTDTANPATTMPGPGWSSRNMAMVTAAMRDAVDNAAPALSSTPYDYLHLPPSDL